MQHTLLSLVLLLLVSTSHGQDYKNPDLPIEERVQDLLSRMTPEEKFWQLFMIPGDLGENPEMYKHGIFGFQVHAAGTTTDIAQQMLDYKPGANARETAIKINDIQRFFLEESRLGIPIIPFDEALHGLIREGATAFPQAIALSATWNTSLMQGVAEAIALEARSRGIRQILSPVINLANDVRWGRTEETYGEDPFLVTEMGMAYIATLEQNGVIATPKHFVANVGDGGRDSYPIHWSERFLRETHLPPFETSIRQGGARSIMTAYNAYEGRPATANDWLLNQLLKTEWNFRGFVISDAGATGGANVLHMTATDYADATAQSFRAGLDVIFQTSYDHYKLFAPPFLDGTIPQDVIDHAVARVLRAKFELGLFENPYVDPLEAQHWNGHPDHRKLAEEAARESIVLLQNKGQILPLSRSTGRIAVIGADALEARLGGYSGPGNNKISILEGLQNLAHAQVHYAYGCSRINPEWVTIPQQALNCVYNGEKQPGLKGEYYNNVSWQGNPVFIRTDAQIDFQWTLFSPDPEKLDNDFYSVRWQGTLQAPESGTFKIGIDGNDGYRLYLNGELLIDNFIKRSRQLTLADYTFEAGREYNILIEFYEPRGNAWFNLVWNVGVQDESPLMEEAIQLAASSDVAIVVVGIEEGEFLDRALLGLPGRQEALIHKLAATGTPLVVLLVGGSPVTMTSWMDEAQAIMAVWYPGEAGGEAIARILFGDYSPAGRLPISWPVHEGQLPLVYNHKPTGRGDDYINLTGQALFPFGFGLSYTHFAYDDIRLGSLSIAPDDTTWVSVKVQNTGGVDSDEVVQLYIRDEHASLARPVIELKGFQRIHLKAGESQEVRFAIHPHMLSMLNDNLEPIVEPGIFRIMIGASSRDIRQRALLKVIEN